MATESENSALFNDLRLMAMVAGHLNPLRKEVADAQWADYGRAVHEHLHGERFLQAVFCALASFNPETKEHPQHHVARRLRVFLTTGTIA